QLRTRWAQSNLAYTRWPISTSSVPCGSTRGGCASASPPPGRPAWRRATAPRGSSPGAGLVDGVRPGGPLAGGAAVLREGRNRRRPAPAALADWGKSHRFAGSSDRASVGNLVYDALRRQRSLAAQMDSERPRALALAAAPRALGLTVAATIASADGSPH